MRLASEDQQRSTAHLQTPQSAGRPHGRPPAWRLWRESLSSSAIAIIMCFSEFFLSSFIIIFHLSFFLPTVLCSSPELCSVKDGDGEFHLIPSPGHSVLLLYLSTPSPRIMHISQGAVQRSASLSRDSEVGVLFLIEMGKKKKKKGSPV